MRGLKRGFSVILALCIIFAGTVQGAAAVDGREPSTLSWNVQIDRIELLDVLYTEETITNYDGSTQILEHRDVPSDGMIYALVTIRAEKQDVLSGPLNAAAFKLAAPFGEYSRLRSDAFLEDHGYTVFSAAEEVTISGRGTICFEIPEEYKGESPLGWSVFGGNVVSSPYQGASEEVPVEPNIVERQSEVETYLLAAYENGGQATIQDPFIQLDPYGTAPLSALVMFETDEAVPVEVTIHGKDGAPDFTYAPSAEETHHEVAVIGLYADFNNTVTLTAGDETSTIEIQTAALPGNMELPTVTKAKDSEILENGFVFMAGNYRTLVDAQGEVRWYSTIQTGYDPSGVDLVGVKEGIWFSTDPYNLSAEIYNQSWLGKIYNHVTWTDNAHHDIAKVTQNEYLYWSGNRLVKLDVDTGEIGVYFDPASVLDSTVDSLEIRQERVGDWLHPNTVSYQDGYVYLSFRNQHMILKMDYDTKEIIWVATPAYSKDEQGAIHAVQDSISDKIVLPAEDDADFEWFYSQHEIVPLPDVDGNPNTDDFTIFDNGEDRGVYGLYDGITDKNSFYSRIVHYRVDYTEKTITQVFDWGKDAYPSLASYYYGGAQYIAEQGETAYLGCFGMLDFGKGTQYGNWVGSKIVLVSDEGEAECTWHFANRYTYRAHYLKMDDFSEIRMPELGTPGTALYEGNASWEEWQASENHTTVNYKLNDISIQKDGKLSLTGWAYLPSAIDQARRVYLIANGTAASYKIKLLANYAGMIPEEEGVPEGYRQGFIDRTVSTVDLPDDVYELGLLVEAGGEVGYAVLPYTITVGTGATEVSAVPCTDLLVTQKEANEQMMAALDSQTYTLQHPFVSVDPYGISPLTAIAVFQTERPAAITISVESKDGAEPITNAFSKQTAEHQIPIYGLYSGEPTEVTLTATYEDGTVDKHTMMLTGGALPNGFVSANVTYADSTQMADGWTFVTAGSLYGYTYALDETGTVRWLLNSKGAGAVGAFLPLQNGHILTGGDKSEGQYYKYSLWEMDLTGYIYREYMLDGIHHDAVEMENGNFLVAVNNPDGKTKEDTICEIDRSTGEIVRVWDLNSYFNVPNTDASGEHTADVNYGSSAEDWFHNNSLDYRQSDHSVIISGRHQDAVIKLNLETGTLDWILSDPNDLWTEEQRGKLLQPVGENFEWQYGQHCAKWLPNGDIFIFDNGNFRSKTAEGTTDAATQGYSRAAIYRVNEQEGTVQQIWEFGKSYGPELLAAYVSSVEYLEEDHYLIDFGGIVKDSGGNASYNNLAGIGGSSQTQIFEIKNDQIIFHASLEQENLGGNTYRAQRLYPYSSSEEMDLSVQGTRIGSLYRYGKANEAVLDYDLPEFNVKQADIADNGAQLTVSFVLDSTCTDAKLYLVGVYTYAVELSAGVTVSGTINASELPVGAYRLFLVCNGELCDLRQTWENTVVAREFPEYYLLHVNTENPDYGWTEGSGRYYMNTAVTLTAHTLPEGQFDGWYHGATLLSENTQYTFVPTEDMQITARFSSQEEAPSGGSGGGGGGGAAEEEQPGAVTEPDGSVTTTVNNPDGSTTTTTKGSDGAVFVTTEKDGKVKIQVTLPANVISTDSTVVPLQISNVDAKKDFDSAAEITFLLPDGMSAVVEIPVQNPSAGVVAMRVTASGAREIIKTTALTPNGIEVKISKDDVVKIVDNRKVFDDVPSTYWSSEAVMFVTSRELFLGTDENTFSPDATMTRAMIMTVLARLDGVDTSVGEYWFDAGRTWAMSHGITDGSNPQAPITRQQLAAMLYRYAGQPDMSGSLDAFDDADRVSDWAKNPMTWAIQNKILFGMSDGTLNPQGLATRAQVATILMRFCQLQYGA